MITESKVKNQHQQVLYYLYNFDNFSLSDVIRDSMFFKFQTRLSDIEKDLGKLIAVRTPKTFINRFGRKSSYNRYKAIDRNEIKELFTKY